MFLLAGQAARPIFDLTDGLFQARAFAFFYTGIQLVLVGEFLVVFRELLLQHRYLFRRQRGQDLGRIRDAAVYDDLVARAKAVDEPGDVLGLQAVLRLVDRGGQERRVFGQLLVTMPREQPVQPRGEIAPLLAVKVEVSVGAPCQYDVRLLVTQASSPLQPATRAAPANVSMERKNRRRDFIQKL